MIQDSKISSKVEDAEIVWRYMDFTSFYALLHSKALFFRRLDKYTDEYEGVLPDEVKEYLFQTWSTFPPFGPDAASDMITKFCSRLSQLNTGTLSNSWVARPQESYAMWKIYLRGSQDGIAIKSTAGRIREVFSEHPETFTLSKVTYEMLPWPRTDYKTLAAYKSEPYSYESELRILLYDQFKGESSATDVFPKEPLYENGASFAVELESLIDSIYISPFAGGWFNDVIKSAILSLMPWFSIDRIITSRIKDK